MTLYFVLEIYDDVTQWRINHEAMEARASGPQFLGQKIGPAFRLSSNIWGY